MKISNLKRDLRLKILNSKHVYVTGHKEIDLDAFGSIIGIVLICKKYKKSIDIIIDDTKIESAVLKAIEKVKGLANIIKSSEIQDITNSLLIVVDVNNKDLVSCYKKPNKFQDIVVIDHHNLTKDSITTGLIYTDVEASSTCEIMVELLKLFNVSYDETVATLLLAGIVLDTNNYILKATEKTFYISYYLTSLGASPTKVQYLLKQDLKKIINRQKILTNIRIINKTIAIAIGSKKDKYRREDLARVADTLLLFNNIETSFVIGNLNNEEIGISGRTLGNKNIGKIMNKLDGGGNKSEGATRIKNKSIKEVEADLIKVLKN